MKVLLYKGKNNKVSDTGGKALKLRKGNKRGKKKKPLSLRSGVRKEYVLSPGLHLEEGQKEL